MDIVVDMDALQWKKGGGKMRVPLVFNCAGLGISPTPSCI